MFFAGNLGRVIDCMLDASKVRGDCAGTMNYCTFYNAAHLARNREHRGVGTSTRGCAGVYWGVHAGYVGVRRLRLSMGLSHGIGGHIGMHRVTYTHMGIRGCKGVGMGPTCACGCV